MVSQLITQTRSRFPSYAGAEIAVEALEKGGSDRKFYRMQVGEGRSLILAKYGVQRDENRHYVMIARFLSEVGVRVPEIYHHDEEESLIWMEDLGHLDLWSYRHESWETRRELYRSALSQILALHTRAHLAATPDVPRLQTGFNAELYQWEQGYFFENCLQRHFGIDESTLAEEGCHGRLGEIAEDLAGRPRAFVHRDFQSQNIVIKDGAACLIDFQGMRPGLIQYDLASLLYDPYVELTAAERAELIGIYLAEWDDLGEAIPEDFEVVYDLCAMQRLMQALGAYGFLGIVKERADFLAHIPAAMVSLREVVARIPGLERLSGLLARL